MLKNVVSYRMFEEFKKKNSKKRRLMDVVSLVRGFISHHKDEIFWFVMVVLFILWATVPYWISKNDADESLDHKKWFRKKE